MRNKVAFWLVPAEPDRTFFQTLIDQLAARYDAPSFTPHVTIYSGEYTPVEAAIELLKVAIAGRPLLRLQVDRLLYTNQFTKTLFVQFHPSSDLSDLSISLKTASSQPADFVLNPHLSLIYCSLEEAEKQALVNQLTLPQAELWFDQVWAITTPEPVQNRGSVERWQVLSRQKLIPPGAMSHPH